MKKTLIKIIFFGSGPVASASLDFLSKYFDIETVITKSTPPHHKGLAPVEELAKQKKLNILYANTKLELDKIIESKKFNSHLGIIVDYGVIVSQRVINSFELGIINSHFSLLPQWRGADPITYSILSGQKKTGVSLMVIEPTLDTGKLITFKSINIDPNETTPSLTDRLIDLSNKLLLEYIPKYYSGEIKTKNQPHPDRATYSHKLTKSDGQIDWQKPAEVLEREIRAYIQWPKSHTKINDNNIIITQSHVANKKESLLHVECGDGKFLSIDKLIAPSGRIMYAKDFLNGYNSKNTNKPTN